ncbi:hypothetical protein JCM10213_008713 [Rhodosporidiobolus nylandii]
MLRSVLLSALVAAVAVRGSTLSTSVFPNSACSGAGSSMSGYVGVGGVKLPDGSVQLHCGCPTDGLDSFETCPSSATGMAVCNSVLDMETGKFTASCGTVTCSGSDCPTTVVNTIVTGEDACYNKEKGSIGITVVDGTNKCACSADAEKDFTACPSPANGRATCSTVDSDFMGVTFEHSEQTSCGVNCDEGYFLSPGGSCITLAKREVVGPSGLFNGGGAGKVGPSASWHPAPTDGPIKAGPSATSKPHHSHSPSARPVWHSSAPHSHGSHGPSPAVPTSHHPHAAHTPSFPNTETTTTTSPYSYKHHHHQKTPEAEAPHGSSTRPSWHTPSSQPIKVAHPSSPSWGHHSHTPAHHGSHAHHPTTRPSWQTKVVPTPSPAVSTGGFSSRGPGKVGPSATYGGPGKVGPGASQAARVRRSEEVVFDASCAQDERTCAASESGDYTCVRLDDVSECGGCHSSGDAQNCLEIVGASSVACLRGGCVVRSCQTGFVQTSEGTCEPKA